MNVFTKWISKNFKGAFTAFKTFPISIASALAFAIVTIIRIQLNWNDQEPYNFLLNCINWGLALGAIFGLAAIAAARSWYNNKEAFIIANLLSALVVILTVVLLCIFGGAKVSLGGSTYTEISQIAQSRVIVAILVSFIAFIIIASYAKNESDFSRSFFMTEKAFFIAMLYGLVIMGGASGVGGAIESLLYNNMSEKVYMYIGTLSGFLAFTIFIGYFPDFSKGQVDERLKVAENQPRFIEVLFEYIMIPIMTALTLVLLIWSGKTVLDGMKVPFTQLSGIATAYTVFGIWLHVMVTHYKTYMAKLYRSVYPFAALVILAIEAWALFIQLQKYGLKTTEYSFVIIWIIACISSILLIILKGKSHVIIAITISVMAVFSVLPVVGYKDLPVTSQINRLESLLRSQGMIKDNQLSKAVKEPEREVRESITDAVNYLAYTKDAKLPAWFDSSLSQGDVFENKLGFQQVWPNSGGLDNAGHLGTNIMLPSGALDISDYQWVVNLQNESSELFTSIKGNKGEYKLYWNVNKINNIPTLKILLNDEVIMEKNMKAYLDNIMVKYPPGNEPYVGIVKDMSLEIDTLEVDVLVIFRNININVYSKNDTINYWMEPYAVYIREK
ncbi:protein of unknown function [Hathewaya proteolytica DSM 3090]|uniref:DUF4153 domain-containing protein n=1 Tax=Hathewaya proteolytica DSM 3090 TaxID=1121331 RepID=A0A1M6JSN9_9CLOT|nr:DUF4153 domain-containing protein [Hathewaya proteolytica]SHJ49683.1 protein of unknown function [Hathewaya proteolytica DSM 3090]